MPNSGPSGICSPLGRGAGGVLQFPDLLGGPGGEGLGLASL